MKCSKCYDRKARIAFRTTRNAVFAEGRNRRENSKCYCRLGKKRAWLGCTPKGAYGNTAFWEGFWEGSGKGSGKGVLRRVLRRGSSMGFTVKKGSEKGSQKRFWEGSFQKVPRTPPCRVRPLRRAPYWPPHLRRLGVSRLLYMLPFFWGKKAQRLIGSLSSPWRRVSGWPAHTCYVLCTYLFALGLWRADT